MIKIVQFGSRHFGALFLGYLWLNSSVLAVLVGRPMLGLLGIVTVLPFLIAYALRAR